MKKMITFILGAAMAISLVGCSGNNGSSNHGGSGDGSTSSYTSAVEVLETVYGIQRIKSSPSAAAIRST